jgi:6-phosphogluconolactonase
VIDAEWWEYDDAEELAEAVSGDIAYIIGQALEARGAAMIALPGGALAQPVLDLLANSDVEWRDVTILPTHDALVAPTDAKSIAGQLARVFLPKKARVLPLAAGEKDAQAAGRAADTRVADLAWPLDAACLTVGDDGSVAGIAPGSDLEAAIAGPKARRALGTGAGVTLTGPALVSARTVTLIVSGKAQRSAVETALKQGAASALPIGRLLAELDMDIDIHWCP